MPCVTSISDMTNSMTQTSRCKRDTFISVCGTLTHALGFMESQFQTLNCQIFHNFQTILSTHRIRFKRSILLMGEDKVGKCCNSLTTISDRFMTPLSMQSQQILIRCYFVDGPAGTGKTFLYNTIVHNLQALGIKVTCMAYSGSASTLLINGATAHSTFQIPIPLLHNSVCNVK